MPYTRRTLFVGRRERCRKRCLRISWRWINSGLIIIIAPLPPRAQRNLQCAQSAGNLCVMVWRAEGAFAQHFAWCITREKRWYRGLGQLLVPHRPSVSAPFWWPPAASFHLLLYCGSVTAATPRHASSRARRYHIIWYACAQRRTTRRLLTHKNWRYQIKTNWKWRLINGICNPAQKIILKEFLTVNEIWNLDTEI